MPANFDPLQFTVDRVPTPIGDMVLVVDHDGVLRASEFFDHEERMRTLLRQQYQRDGKVTMKDGTAPKPVRAAFEAYYDGELTAIDRLKVKTGGTPFQREVWRLLRTIRPGKTTSYGKLAVRIGLPNAARAVGMANGANPISLVVPCHRVIGADASLTGYGGGIARKQWLLRHEGAAFKSPAMEVTLQLPGI